MNANASENPNTDKIWDCIVIGAGPAGAMAAREIAKRNKEVLLIDKASFPRAKVCGCCINSSGVSALQMAGLNTLLSDNGAILLDSFMLFDGQRRANISLPVSYALSREKFDMSLINAAIDYGVQFYPTTSGKILSLEEFPRVQICSDKSAYIARAKIVIVADGLAGNALELLSAFKPIVKPNSRFGASVILDHAPEYVEAAKIYMACGRGGYVGMVRLEDGRLNLAVALDHKFSKQLNGPGKAAADLLQGCGLAPPPALSEAHWAGTNLLTRSRPQTAGKRLFIVGDACGYAEPFTGEGMAWALWSGFNVADLVVEGIDQWQPNLVSKWHSVQRELSVNRLRCEILALMLRNNMLRTMLIDVCANVPSVVRPVVNLISGGRTNNSERLYGRG